MTDDSQIGLEPVPDDGDIVAFLEKRYVEASEKFEKLFAEFQEVIQMGKEDDEPAEFAYARLLNHLATLRQPDLINILAVVMWRVSSE